MQAFSCLALIGLMSPLVRTHVAVVSVSGRLELSINWIARDTETHQILWNVQKWLQLIPLLFLQVNAGALAACPAMR
jgi:hypothetical protein